MSAQYTQSSSVDGVRTYIDRNGDTVQESDGPVPIFRGLAAAGGEAFISDSESESEEEVHHHHAPNYIPQTTEKKSKKEKKEKKSKKSKKDRSGSSSSGHACNCSHSH